MIFHADKNIETRNCLFPEHRFFPFVQLYYHQELIYVDIKEEAEDGRYATKHLIAGTIPLALELIDSFPHEHVQLALQLRRSETADGKYAIADICEIVEAKYEVGSTVYVCICENGIRYISPAITDNEDSLTDFETVYLKAAP